MLPVFGVSCIYSVCYPRYVCTDGLQLLSVRALGVLRYTNWSRCVNNDNGHVMSWRCFPVLLFWCVFLCVHVTIEHLHSDVLLNRWTINRTPAIRSGYSQPDNALFSLASFRRGRVFRAGLFYDWYDVGVLPPCPPPQGRETPECKQQVVQALPADGVLCIHAWFYISFRRTKRGTWNQCTQDRWT